MAIFNCTTSVITIYNLNLVSFNNGRYYLNNIASPVNQQFALSGQVLNTLLGLEDFNPPQSVNGISVLSNSIGVDSPAGIIGSNILTDTYIVDVFYKITYDILNPKHTVKLYTVGRPVYNNPELNEIVGYLNLAK